MHSNEAVLTSTTIYVLSRNMKKYQNFYLKIFILVVKFSIYLNRHVFVMIKIILLRKDKKLDTNWTITDETVRIYVSFTQNTFHLIADKI